MFQKIKNRLRSPREKMHIHVPKPIRNALISVGVLLTLSVVAGVGYTYYMGLNPAQDATAIATPVEASSNPIIKPTEPAANAKESASVQTLTTPVAAGSNASITVRTNAGSTCTITAVYNNVASTDSGLAPKPSDVYGMVTWTWTVDKQAPIGTWPIKVTCTYNGHSAVVQADLQVVKQI